MCAAKDTVLLLEVIVVSNVLLNAVVDSDSIDLKYDPMGNRICKDSTINGNHRYILDLASFVPKVLLVLDADNNNAILTRYVHTDREVLMQQDVSIDERYYYLHDRLGSVRLIIDDAGTVVNSYTYNPFGMAFASECSETISNPYQFAGYFWDDEIKQYYCNARYYDPVLMRFTSYDPVMGKFEEPMTLHKYLYCTNDPVNWIDPSGLDKYIGVTPGHTYLAVDIWSEEGKKTGQMRYDFFAKSWGANRRGILNLVLLLFVTQGEVLSSEVLNE